MFSRTLQSVNEKLGGADATHLPDQFRTLEKRVDVTNDLVEDIVVKTKEYLQPNPANRAKLNAAKKISKLSGTQSKSSNSSYPQPEGILGEVLLKYATKLGDDGNFVKALNEIGESLKLMAEEKYSLEDEVRQNIFEPLNRFQMSDLKDVNHLRKDMNAKRLDFDRKRQRKKISSAEVAVAEEQFLNSFKESELAMHKLVNNEVEYIALLHALANSLYNYHAHCAEIMRSLEAKLTTIKSTAARSPVKEFIPSTIPRLGMPSVGSSSSFFDGHADTPPPYTAKVSSGATGFSNTNLPTKSPGTGKSQPRCRALYDFKRETPEDLEFHQGDIISLLRDIDDDWYEGVLNGQRGCFPKTYVEVIVPLW